jgi:hypothetical protein
MGYQVNLAHPDITDSPSSNIDGDLVAGATAMSVKNNTVFSLGDFLLIGKYGGAQTEVTQITGSITPGEAITVSALLYSHVSDTTVTKIPFNEVVLTRSLTGIGGTYTTLTTFYPQVSQFSSQYIDTTGVSPYSYQYYFLNSTTGGVSGLSAELPYGGYFFDALDTLQKRVLDLYVDKQGEFISPDSIRDWFNELLGILNRAVTDSESAPFINFFTITPGGAASTDISSYNAEVISFIEYSTDGGNTYPVGNTIGPMDSRVGSQNSATVYSWMLRADSLFIYNAFPSNYVVRVWYFSQQPLLQVQSDRLPTLYRSWTEVFVNYGLMRSYERARRFQESALYYKSKYETERDVMVPKIRSRINQGNQTMGTDWLDSFNMY